MNEEAKKTRLARNEFEALPVAIVAKQSPYNPGEM